MARSLARRTGTALATTFPGGGLTGLLGKAQSTHALRTTLKVHRTEHARAGQGARALAVLRLTMLPPGLLMPTTRPAQPRTLLTCNRWELVIPLVGKPYFAHRRSAPAPW